MSVCVCHVVVCGVALSWEFLFCPALIIMCCKTTCTTVCDAGHKEVEWDGRGGVTKNESVLQ